MSSSSVRFIEAARASTSMGSPPLPAPPAPSCWAEDPGSGDDTEVSAPDPVARREPKEGTRRGRSWLAPRMELGGGSLVPPLATTWGAAGAAGCSADGDGEAGGEGDSRGGGSEAPRSAVVL